jgi:hypothetical protein
VAAKRRAEEEFGVDGEGFADFGFIASDDIYIVSIN